MSVFEIGSITKAFTGILLADMAARGEVSLTDPVSKHLPAGVTMPSRGREITLLDLATHRSGLPRLPSNMSPADRSNPYADYTVQQLYAFLSGHTLGRDVGAQYEYSNLGGGLLGHVLGRAASRSYEALVRERILQPLGMSMTGVTLTGDMREQLVAGHDMQGNVVPLWDLPTLAGAGALRSNMRDMLAFLGANFGPPTSLLERSMMASHEVRETAGPGMSIGLGWHILTVRDRKIVWHNGGTAGFRTFIGFDPDAHVGVVVLGNSAHIMDDIGFHLINPAVPLAAAPVQRVAVTVPAAILQTYVGEYVLAPTFSIVISLERGALFGQATGQPRFAMFAESEREFFLRDVDAQVTFERDANGVVTGLVLHQGGQNIPGRKVR
jgi:CubicO group peptidase (beta-lactamase class C family)